MYAGVHVMNEKPASKILKQTMGWKEKEITDNLADLQALSKYGYDEYQQFRPGMRFIESLASWLNQLPSDKRNTAFQFIKKRLLYVTHDQMKQIISIVYQDYIIPILLKQVSREIKPQIPYWNVAQILASDEFKVLLRKCLFVGLSDGSQIDIFRRSNSAISHEQVYRTHEINSTRKDKIKDALSECLNPKEPNARFRNIFLLDDFSGSGKTYLNEAQSSPHGMDGKIASFYASITDPNDPFSELVNINDLRVWLVLYVATEYAKTRLQELGTRLFSTIPFSVIVIHTIPDSIKYQEREDIEFTKLIQDEKFGSGGLANDRHMQMGDTSRPYLGFDACALPLILNHNTPNNSLPILHRNDQSIAFKGLFPRASRHQ